MSIIVFLNADPIFASAPNVVVCMCVCVDRWVDHKHKFVVTLWSETREALVSPSGSLNNLFRIRLGENNLQTNPILPARRNVDTAVPYVTLNGFYPFWHGPRLRCAAAYLQFEINVAFREHLFHDAWHRNKRYTTFGPGRVESMALELCFMSREIDSSVVANSVDCEE